MCEWWREKEVFGLKKEMAHDEDRCGESAIHGKRLNYASMEKCER